MAVATPPVRTKPNFKTKYGAHKYYTLHTGSKIWACRPQDAISSVVAFRNVDDAVLVGCMIETHYIHNKEWPEFNMENITLPSSRIQDLNNIFLKKWEFDDLKLICTSNMLDMISVDDINKLRSSYTFSGNQYKFSANIDFYKNRFDELFRL